MSKKKSDNVLFAEISVVIIRFNRNMVVNDMYLRARVRALAS